MSVFCVYIFDEQMGPEFIKICSYFPYPVKVCGKGARMGQAAGGPAGPGLRARMYQDRPAISLMVRVAPWSPVWCHLRGEGT